MRGRSLTFKLKQRAKNEGFDLCRFTSADLPLQTGEWLEQAIDNQHHASMAWMETTLERRKTPQAMWQGAKSAIILGVNYGPDYSPMENLDLPQKATISVYARGRDYHDYIKGKLKTLAGWYASQSGEEVKVFVDTAPLMEKPLAAQAGIGWQGKHTNLVSREFGSWLFLGVILTTAQLERDDSESDHCGSCSSCLNICPTDAFPGPYQLDARRCISYLTIEHDGAIPHEFREKIGNRIYGCDDCLAVCPWNKYAKTTKAIKLSAREDLIAPDLAALVQLDDAGFRQMFSGSPIKRIKRTKFIRNVLIAIGNSGLDELKSHVINLLNDEDEVIRGAAVWALSRLESRDNFAQMKQNTLKKETAVSVRKEWEAIGT